MPEGVEVANLLMLSGGQTSGYQLSISLASVAGFDRAILKNLPPAALRGPEAIAVTWI
jgi:hypothetical protein